MARFESCNQERRSRREYEDTGTRDGLGLQLQCFHEAERGDQTTRRRATCIVFMDLDGFKLINDTCGHPSGDQAPQHFANVCRSSSGSCDVGPPGGDEVLMLLPRRMVIRPG